MWVILVLHALNKHSLDDLHIMLLLVAEDSWEVPKDDNKHTGQPLNMQAVDFKLQQYGLENNYVAPSEEDLTRICAGQILAG